jgi:hypothetical protein
LSNCVCVCFSSWNKPTGGHELFIVSNRLYYFIYLFLFLE